MVIKSFPPVDTADEYGIVGIGGDLEVESLELAYRSGIFPWPINNQVLTWFAPEKRAVLFIDKYRRSKSFEKFLKNNPYTVIVNQNFEAVIRRCQQIKRAKDNATWITKQMLTAYIELHRAGMAFSVEAYQDQNLVGGLYGVNIGMYCGGESMFHDQPNASKCCFDYLVHHCRSKGLTWIDCQVINPFTKQLGAIEISRDDYMRLLLEVL